MAYIVLPLVLSPFFVKAAALKRRGGSDCFLARTIVTVRWSELLDGRETSCPRSERSARYGQFTSRPPLATLGRYVALATRRTAG